ncbi:hypothetical protein N0V94_004929 [Neodidymelliopsis sp. IMI 364377]|nr:hypothetical protein N0V94_004929 [Neodidymelliopsis sp. IMI 364377]
MSTMPEAASSATSKPPETLLSFSQYKARFGLRNDDELIVYDPTLEQFPDDAWYTLEHDKINNGIHEMCSQLLYALRNRQSSDSEISSLHDALKIADIVPRGKEFYAAFLGEQGIGKSSLINAVFNRDLVNVSSSSSACTTFPTIITYKTGASDDAQESDVYIEYLNDEDIRDCAEEQARRYRDAFPRKCPVHEVADVDDDSSREASFSDSEPEEEDEEDTKEEEEDFDSDEEADEVTLCTPTNNSTSEKRKKKVSRSVLRGARTARLFFEIIFNTERDETNRRTLEDALEKLDIEDGSFAALCVEHANQRLSEIHAHNGVLQHDAISDEDLTAVRTSAESVWPLVRSVRLATGHVLLRNNVCILDLPGYGDDNHMRTALIDRFREMANFEIVVAPTSRVVSSIVQERYLSRSIRRLGARNTLLVTNKSDQLLDGIRKQIGNLKEPPFMELQQHLTNVEATIARRTKDMSYLRAYRDYLLKEARSAYIKRESEIVNLKLQDNCVDILAVSARQYSLCMDAFQDDEKPKLTPEATGIPQLRRYLFSLPAQTNYRTLHYHVFETLPDIVAQIQRILEKVRTNIDSVAKSLPANRVIEPWNMAADKIRINLGLKAVVQALAHPIVYYSTFNKMLKENGIPTVGAGLGLNLNQEILHTLGEFVEQWYRKMQDQTENIALCLEAPVQAMLKELKNLIEQSSSDPELKRGVSESLETTTRRIGVSHGKLAADLQNTLRENYLLFSTEVNIKCPIALEMKDTYLGVLLQGLVQAGKGSYGRRRTYLQGCLIDPAWPKSPFAEVMRHKITKAQVASWNGCCEQFVSATLTLLDDFARITDELLDNGSRMTSEHRRIREQLEVVLPEFKRQLNRVQNQFPGGATFDIPASIPIPRPYTKKRKLDGDGSASQPSPLTFNNVKRAKAFSQASQLGPISRQPVGWLRNNSLSKLEQAQKTALKREPSP